MNMHEDKMNEMPKIEAAQQGLVDAIDSLLISKSADRNRTIAECLIAFDGDAHMKLDPREVEGHLKDINTLITMLADLLHVRDDGEEQSLFIREWLAGRKWLAFLDRVARRDAEAGPQECYELRLSIDGVVVVGERGKGTLKDALGRMIEGK